MVRTGLILESRFHDVYLPQRKDIRVIFWAPHAAAPRREFFTGVIVRELHRRLGLAGIVGQVPRVIADLNRSKNHVNTFQEGTENYQATAVEDFYEQLEKVLTELKVLNEDGKVNKGTLLFGIHGMKNRTGYGIVLGTINGKLCPIELRNTMKEKLETLLNTAEIDTSSYPVKCEDMFPGDPSLEELRNHFGEKLFIIQMEIVKTLREEYTEEIIAALSMLALTFPKLI